MDPARYVDILLEATTNMARPIFIKILHGNKTGTRKITAFFYWGEIVTLVFDERGCLKCPTCGSLTFDMVTETRASDITMDKDGPADYSIETERAVSIICARCGVRIVNEQNNLFRKRERHQ